MQKTLMTKKELSQLIIEEIESNNIDNWHGISKKNIKSHLIDPILFEFVTAWNMQVKKYWLVLDEIPGDKKDGYQIVYDQEKNMFGLATKTGMDSQYTGVMIGLYGSFIQTLNGM